MVKTDEKMLRKRYGAQVKDLEKCLNSGSIDTHEYKCLLGQVKQSIRDHRKGNLYVLGLY